MALIRLAIADDHAIFRKGVRAVLDEHASFDVVLEAGNGRELIEGIAIARPDVILMDIKMPEMDGLEATRFVKKYYSHIKVLALSIYDDDSYIFNMMRAGAQGYLLKSAEPAEITGAIITVYEKNYYFNDQISVSVLSKLLSGDEVEVGYKAQVELNEREIEVLRLICKEFTNAQIADAVSVSIRTAEGYRQSLLTKTDSRNTAGLVVYAIRNKVIQV